MIRHKIKKYLILILPILFIVFQQSNFSQWASDPSSNTILVVDPSDPINISATADNDNGAFIVWQDSKHKGQSDIYFLHVNQAGEVSFRADGKTVSSKNIAKLNPISSSTPNGETIILWSEKDSNNLNQLFIQRVTKKGLQLWGTDGMQLSFSKDELLDYAVTTDNKNRSYISSVVKENSASGKYKVLLNVLSSGGKNVISADSQIIFKSDKLITSPLICTQANGDVMMFWLQSKDSKMVLNAFLLNSNGKKKWDKPLTLSNPGQSVLGFLAQQYNDNIYILWQEQGTQKKLFHQLLNESGKTIWGTNGKLVTNLEGIKYNPQITINNNGINVSWTNEIDKNKDIYVQCFNVNGKEKWNTNGITVIKEKDDQFGQKIISDKNNNLILAWIDRRVDAVYGNIYVQKIDETGDLLWDAKGVEFGSHHNTPKSYLYLIPDNSGGAIAIFKDKRENKSNIYGQKIFSTGTYASQILGFKTELAGDSVKIFWFAANEADGTIYEVQRIKNPTDQPDDWKTIGSIEKGNTKSANYYEQYDWPGESGTFLYRVVQINSNGKNQISEINQIDFLTDSETLILAQNNPNPFQDSTTISFYLPEEQHIELEIFDSKVNLVEKLADKNFPGGKNSITFYGTGLLPGVYFYRLKAGDVVEVKKMIVAGK